MGAATQAGASTKINWPAKHIGGTTVSEQLRIGCRHRCLLLRFSFATCDRRLATPKISKHSATTGH